MSHYQTFGQQITPLDRIPMTGQNQYQSPYQQGLKSSAIRGQSRKMIPDAMQQQMSPQAMQQMRAMMQPPPQHAPPAYAPQQPLYAPQHQQQQPVYAPPPAAYMPKAIQYLAPSDQGYPMPMPAQMPSCDSTATHIAACKACADRYKQNHAKYIGIIVVLVMLVMFLATKVVDKAA